MVSPSSTDIDLGLKTALDSRMQSRFSSRTQPSFWRGGTRLYRRVSSGTVVSACPATRRSSLTTQSDAAQVRTRRIPRRAGLPTRGRNLTQRQREAVDLPRRTTALHLNQLDATPIALLPRPLERRLEQGLEAPSLLRENVQPREC